MSCMFIHFCHLKRNLPRSTMVARRHYSSKTMKVETFPLSKVKQVIFIRNKSHSTRFSNDQCRILNSYRISICAKRKHIKTSEVAYVSFVVFITKHKALISKQGEINQRV